jgi:hypothetical protein
MCCNPKNNTKGGYFYHRASPYRNSNGLRPIAGFALLIDERLLVACSNFCLIHGLAKIPKWSFGLAL